MAEREPDADPFLAEAVRRGLMDASQAQDCLRIAAALREIADERTLDEIAARKGFVTPDQAAEIRRALARLRVGRYEVIERLGEGAAGVVWRARDTKLDRVVALKVLSQKAQEVPAFRERFLREARIAVSLNHVNIVRGLDYGEVDGYHFFAMEFVEGEDAERRMEREGRFAEKDAVAMALDVVRALSYVQKFNIVHRDIKPSNLLLMSTGHVKVCDLGLAKPMLAESRLMFGDGTTSGTPLYMSPEQIRDPERTDWRADVYSLGATLYHLMTGVPVFRGDGTGGILQKHLHEQPASPREHVLELSDAVASVVMRMLQKEPDARYASLEEVASDLESVLTGRTPLHAEPPVPPEEATAERHARIAIARRITETNLPREAFPWPIAGALALFVVAAVVGWIAIHGESTASAAAPPVAPSPAMPRPSPAPAVVAAPDPVPDSHPAQPTPGPEANLERRAAEVLETRTALARQAFEDGHYTAAHDALVPFPAEFARTTAADAAKRRADEFDAKAAGRFEEQVTKAKELARRRRPDEAKGLIEQASHMEWTWARDRARSAELEIEQEIRNAQLRRDQQASQFANLYGNVLLAAGRDAEAARAMVARDGRELDAYRDELDELSEDLRVIERHGTDADALEHDTLEGATASLLARLSQGDVLRANAELEALRRRDGDVDAGRRRIQRVEGVLAGRADELLAKAEARRAAGELEVGARLADEARQVLPDYLPADVLLGRIRLDQRDYAAARQLLDDVLRRHRTVPPEAHLRMGQVLAAQNEDLQRAESELRKFVEETPAADPRRAEGEAALKDVHTRWTDGETRRWRAAAAAAKTPSALEGAWGRVLELDHDDPEALFRLGRIYMEKTPKRPQAAFVVLSHLVELKGVDVGKRTDAVRLLKELPGFSVADGGEVAIDGDVHFRNENWDRAISSYRNALLISPHLSSARTRLVQALLARAREKASPEDARLAAETADGLAKLFPDMAEPPALRAEAKLLLGRPREALDDASAAQRLEPRSAVANLALGHALLANGDAKEAAKRFLVAREREECSPQALLGLAACHLAEGRTSDAEAVLEAYRDRHGDLQAWRDEYRELVNRLSAPTGEPPK